jgi:hypothetical protein
MLVTPLGQFEMELDDKDEEAERMQADFDERMMAAESARAEVCTQCPNPGQAADVDRVLL